MGDLRPGTVRFIAQAAREAAIGLLTGASVALGVRIGRALSDPWTRLSVRSWIDQHTPRGGDTS